MNKLLKKSAFIVLGVSAVFLSSCSFLNELDLSFLKKTTSNPVTTTTTTTTKEPVTTTTVTNTTTRTTTEPVVSTTTAVPSTTTRTTPEPVVTTTTTPRTTTTTTATRTTTQVQDDNGFKSYLSTSTQNWYWSVNASTFKFNVYFENKTGRDIKSFNIDLAYSIDGYVRAAGAFENNKKSDGTNIRNGEKVTFTFTVNYNSAYTTYAKNTWKSYYEQGQYSLLYNGYDYQYWLNINKNINHDLILLSYYSLTYAD